VTDPLHADRRDGRLLATTRSTASTSGESSRPQPAGRRPLTTVGEFFAIAKHPTLDAPYTQVGYRPMRELISLLQAHQFTV
jgi:hypothetical protein